MEASGRGPQPVARPPALPVSKRNRPSAQGPQRRHCGPRRSGGTGQLVRGGRCRHRLCRSGGRQGAACDLSPQRRGATGGGQSQQKTLTHTGVHTCTGVHAPTQERLLLHGSACTLAGAPAPARECMVPHRSACSCMGVHGPTQECRHRCAYPHRCDCVSVPALRSGRFGLFQLSSCYIRFAAGRVPPRPHNL